MSLTQRKIVKRQSDKPWFRTNIWPNQSVKGASTAPGWPFKYKDFRRFQAMTHPYHPCIHCLPTYIYIYIYLQWIPSGYAKCARKVWDSHPNLPRVSPGPPIGHDSPSPSPIGHGEIHNNVASSKRAVDGYPFVSLKKHWNVCSWKFGIHKQRHLGLLLAVAYDFGLTNMEIIS